MADLLISAATGKPLGTLLLAHGAGAPMDSAFMKQLTAALNEQGICVVRFEFPYMQKRRATGGKRPPDRQPALLEHWQQVVGTVQTMEDVPKPICIGGKSMGGRMASLYAEQDESICGVCCFGYPFFPPGKNQPERVQHLLSTETPTLIVQGTRDAFGKPDTLSALGLSNNIKLHWLETGDHDFKPTVRSGIEHQQHIRAAAQASAGFFLNLPKAAKT